MEVRYEVHTMYYRYKQSYVHSINWFIPFLFDFWLSGLINRLSVTRNLEKIEKSQR